MKRLTLRLIVLLAAASFARGESAACGTVISVMDYGAAGDGTHNDAPAIQSALDSGASTVVIPAGTYSINQTLLMGSDTTLQADPNAVIRLANGANTLMVSNRSSNASNITLQGGVWDANNQYNQRGADSDPNAYSGCAISFFSVDHLTISDLTVRNPDSFSVRVGNVQNFTIQNISLDDSVARLNQDGIHVNGNSCHGLISGIKAISANTPNDDMVALNADDTLTMTEALVHGMQNGPISNVVVENLRADNAYTFVRLYSNTSRLENVTLQDIKGGFRYYAINMDNHDFPVGAGDIRNVTIDDVSVSKTTTSFPAIDIGLQLQDVHITNFTRNDSLAAPTLVLRNQHDNTLLFGDGSQLETQSYTISQGGIDNLWFNQTDPVPEPGCLSMVAIGVTAMLFWMWRWRRVRD